MVTPETIFGNTGWKRGRQSDEPSSQPAPLTTRPSWWEIEVIQDGEAEKHRFPDEPGDRDN